MSEEELTPEEEQELMEYMGGSYPKKAEREGIFAFLNKVLSTKDTSKVSNIDDQELFSVRTLQNISCFADEMGLPDVAKFIRERAEITLATADSKKGFLIDRAITHKREMQTKLNEGGKKKWGLKKD